MIPIDLLPDTPILSLVANTGSVRRIGEIILIPKATDTGTFGEPRKPWKNLVASTKWKTQSGICVDQTRYDQEDLLWLNAEKWDNEQVRGLYLQQVKLALIQKNENNGFIANVCATRLGGVEVKEAEIRLVFVIDNVDVVRDI